MAVQVGRVAEAEASKIPENPCFSREEHWSGEAVREAFQCVVASIHKISIEAYVSLVDLLWCILCDGFVLSDAEARHIK